MEKFIEFILQHAHHAHWFVFIAILLAGMNIPISTDLLIIISAVLAATVVPENVFLLFSAIFLGCYFSAWIAYWIGRKLGPLICRMRYFQKIFEPRRLEKIKKFYEKYGFLTLLIGRFIPFGVRNCIFMTTGVSRFSFLKFISRDLIACFIWSSSTFFLFYLLGQNYLVLYEYVKTFNLIIFSTFGLAVIAFFWYKKRKRNQSKSASEIS
jgi:membrane-associated protein